MKSSTQGEKKPIPSPSSFLARISARAEATLSTHGFTILFLTMYFVSVSLMFLNGFHTEFFKPSPPPYRLYIAIARGAGYTLNLNTTLVLLLASRLFLTGLRNTAIADVLPLDKAFPLLHIVVAYTITVAVVVHIPFHFIWIGGWNKWDFGVFKVNMTVITGGLLTLVFSTMFIFALPSMRKKHFRLFYFVHLVGASLFFLIIILHGMYQERPETYKFVVPVIFIYLLDRIVRNMRMSSHEIELSTSNSSFKDDNILQISIPKPFEFRPGQYAEIMVPSINREWHPFTISSAQYEEKMCFYIKSQGDWTGMLHSKFQTNLSGHDDESLRLIVRGPFGAPTQEVDKYQRVFLISGGIGGTPFMSICKQLHHRHEMHDAPINSKHIARRDERVILDSLLADGAEHRIRDAVAAIYDVNAQVLSEESSNPVDAARIEYVSDKIRVSSHENSMDGKSNPIPQEHGKSQPILPLTETSKSGIDGDSRHVSFEMEQCSIDDDSGTTPSGGSSDSEDLTPSSMSHGIISMEHKQVDITAPKTAYRRHAEKYLAQPASILDLDKRRGRKTTRLGELRSNLLLFLHTSRVSFFLLLLCIARMALIVTGSIFDSDFVGLGSQPFSSGLVATGRWVPLSFASLSTPLIFILTLTVLLELSLFGGRIVKSARRTLEALIFCPVGIAMTVLEFRTWLNREPGGQTFVLIQYVFLQTIMFILLLGRMWRSVGRRGLVDAMTGEANSSDCKCDRHSHIPDADFVWTTPKKGDDEWLCRELAPVAGGRAVRLHRYVTRADKNMTTQDDLIQVNSDVEGGYKRALWESTKTGRPDWDKLLGEAARDTRSDGVVGIFFCGPPQMGDAIRASAKKVEMWSNLRDAYLRTTNARTLMSDLGLTDPTMVERLRKFGCRVRLVYHEENFS